MVSLVDLPLSRTSMLLQQPLSSSPSSVVYSSTNSLTHSLTQLTHSHTEPVLPVVVMYTEETEQEQHAPHVWHAPLRLPHGGGGATPLWAVEVLWLCCDLCIHPSVEWAELNAEAFVLQCCEAFTRVVLWSVAPCYTTRRNESSLRTHTRM